MAMSPRTSRWGQAVSSFKSSPTFSGSDGFKETLIGNLDQQFQDAGIDDFLKARSYQRVIDVFV